VPPLHLYDSREGVVEDDIVRAVDRVIAAMRDKLGEELTVDDLARVAMFSKFHFSRIFQRVTGVSPGRFLSALRLQQAKRLLVSTSLNVSDISVRVGYNSVGTFSSRFARSVGLSPTAYRRLGGFSRQIVSDDGMQTAGGLVRGRVWAHPSVQPGLVFIGLFPSRIPEGRPARCTIQDGPGPYRFDNVPDGVWYVLSQSVPNPDAFGPFASDQLVSVGSYGPVAIRNNTVIDIADVHLAPMRTFDPPVLLALLDARRAALSLAAANGSVEVGVHDRTFAMDRAVPSAARAS
jgi:AraC family transcriptional regulator